MALAPGQESVLSVWPEQLEPEPELESPVTSLKVLRALGVRGGAEKSMADAALGGMPWRSWVSRTIRGEPSSSPPLSLMGEGSRRFWTRFQSAMALWSRDRGMDLSGGGWLNALEYIKLPAAPPQLFPRTWAAKEGWIGVGILLVMLPGCTRSGCEGPGPRWIALSSCIPLPLSAPSMSMSMSTSFMR